MILQATTKCPPPLFCQIDTRLACLSSDVPLFFFCSCRKIKVVPLCWTCCLHYACTHLVVQYTIKKWSCYHDRLVTSTNTRCKRCWLTRLTIIVLLRCITFWGGFQPWNARKTLLHVKHPTISSRFYAQFSSSPLPVHCSIWKTSVRVKVQPATSLVNTPNTSRVFELFLWGFRFFSCYGPPTWCSVGMTQTVLGPCLSKNTVEKNRTPSASRSEYHLPHFFMSILRVLHGAPRYF